MSIEEIIVTLKALADGAESCAKDTHFTALELKDHERSAEALLAAIALLRTHPDAQPNEPLTLEELMEMDGQPVYLAEDRKWYIVSVNYETHQFKQPCGVDKWGAGTSLSLLARCGVYRRPPKED